MLSLQEIEWLKQASKDLPERKETVKRARPNTEETQIDEISKEKVKRYFDKAVSPKETKNRSKGIRTALSKLHFKQYGNAKVHATEETQIDETLPANAKAGDYVDDFVHSKNKMFSGDSKKQRIKRALGAYYSKKRHEETELNTEAKDDAYTKMHKRTLRMPDAMLGVMGGPTKKQSREYLRQQKVDKWAKAAQQRKKSTSWEEETELDEALEGGAAHKRMVQKMMATGDIHSAISHVVTRYDREQQARAAKNPARSHYNPHALPLYLKAGHLAADDIKGGKNHAEAINTHFNGALANRLHKHLKSGGVDVDTERRKRFGEEKIDTQPWKQTLGELYGKGSVEKIGNWHARMQDKQWNNRDPGKLPDKKYIYHGDQANRADYLGMAISARADRKYAEKSEKSNLAAAKRARAKVKAMKEDTLDEFTFKLNPKKKGMWKGKSMADIKKAKTSAKHSGNVTREREATFAINAKHHFKRSK